MSEALGYTIAGVSIGFAYGLLALGIVLIYKGSRVINFAQPYLAMLCAFVTWWLTARAAFLPFDQGTRPRFVVAAVLGLAIVGLNGYGIEHGLFRRLRRAPRLTLLVATIAIAQGTVGVVALLFNRTEEQASTFRQLPTVLSPTVKIDLGDYVLTAPEIQLLVVAPIVAAAIALFFTRTRYGVAVRAAAENRDAARLLGISADRVAIFTWVAGSLLAGIAGLLIAPRSNLDISFLSTGFLVRGLAAALLGGLTSLPGAMVGGIVVGVVESLVEWQFGLGTGWPETLMFLIVLGVLLFKPGGLFGRPEQTEDKAAFVPALRELPARYRLSEVATWFGRYWIVTSIVFAIALSRVVSGTTDKILVDVLVFAMVGVSLTVLLGFSGQISLGHWGLVGVGAFSMANFMTRLHWSFPIAIVLTIVIGMLTGLLLALPSIRIRGLYLAAVTLAFNLAAERLIFQHRFIARSTAGITVDAPKVGPFDLDALDHQDLFLFALVGLLLSMWVSRNLSVTRTGRGFFALRENEKAAATLGVPLTRYRLLAFAVSGGIAALAGAFWAFNQGLVVAGDFGTALSIQLVAMVVIGGLGSLEGAVLGAFVVFGLPELIHFDNRWIVPIGTGVLLYIVITRAPGGLAGLLHLSRRELVTDLVDLQQTEQQPERAGPVVATR